MKLFFGLPIPLMLSSSFFIYLFTWIFGLAIIIALFVWYCKCLYKIATYQYAWVRKHSPVYALGRPLTESEKLWGIKRNK